MIDAARKWAEDAVITVNGAAFLPDASGALYWPDQGALLVADIHFEKASAYARRGVFLPPYDTRAGLRVLHDLCARYAPRVVISLGDAFHDDGAEQRMARADAEALTALCRTTEWIWIAGNHDPGARAFPGETMGEIRLGPVALRHEPRPGEAKGEIAGHLHPCAKVRRRGRGVRRKCFVSDGTRLVMPSFGALTGGLNVRDEAFAPLFTGFVAWMIGAREIYPVARRDCKPD